MIKLLPLLNMTRLENNATMATYTPLAIPGSPETPWMMPYEKYTALLGLLPVKGTGLIPPAWPDAHPDRWRLRFSGSEGYLMFIQEFFGDWFWYAVNNGHTVANGYPRLQTLHSTLITHLHTVWTENMKDGRYVLPPHFEYHFTIVSLAFWIMQNGQLLSPGILKISVHNLCASDQLRVAETIQMLLGVPTTLYSKNGELRIKEFQKWGHLVKPHMYEPLLARLEPVSRNRRKS